MSEQAFNVGQKVQDLRAGSVGEVVYARPGGVCRVRWASGDESAFAWEAAEQWLRVVEYGLAALKEGGG